MRPSELAPAGRQRNAGVRCASWICGLIEALEGLRTEGGIVADALDVEETSVGLEADLLWSAGRVLSRLPMPYRLLKMAEPYT